jgi:EAL domain-containing protein (putative c-di-GMP-specific phosphodiesterase class I)
MGVKVSIDDFGAGYTSLAHLKSLPVTALKIDRAFITNILERPADQAITEAVIDLGHRLGLTVLAEGVETDAQYQRLSALSCDEVQGYLLTPPLPPNALEGWLTHWQHRIPRPSHSPPRLNQLPELAVTHGHHRVRDAHHRATHHTEPSPVW